MSCPALSVPNRCQPLSTGGWLRHSSERLMRATGTNWCTSTPPTKRTRRTMPAAIATGCRANRRQARPAKNRRRSPAYCGRGGLAASGASGSPDTSVHPHARVEQGEDDLAEHGGGDHDAGGEQQSELQLVGVDGSDTVGVQLKQADEQRPDPSELEDVVDRERPSEEKTEVGDDRRDECDESIPEAVVDEH